MGAQDGWNHAGTGVPTWDDGSAEGVVKEIISPEDVLDLMDGDLDDVIILMHTAGATMLAPIFSELTGIVCTAGNTGAHVAILSREFGVPCLVATELSDPALAGRRVRLDPSGTVHVQAA